LAGITHHPDQEWMEQIARNVTMEDSGFLINRRYLLHDRDSKYCSSLSSGDRSRKREDPCLATQKSESELEGRTLGQVGQRRMSVEADPGWRIVTAASVAAIYRTLPRGAQPSGQRQSDLVSFADGGKKEHGSSAVSRTTGRPAEVLREGSGSRRDSGRWAHHEHKGCRESPPAKDLPHLIYHRRALSNELLLGALTGTSFFTIRQPKTESAFRRFFWLR